MRWLLLIATLLSCVLCFASHSAGVMAVWLFLAIVGAIGTTMAFVHARIQAGTKPELLFDPAPRNRNESPRG